MLQSLKNVAKAAVLRAIVAHDRRRRTSLGMLDSDLHPANWDAEIGPEGHLVIGGCDTVELARRFGTPLHVVDRARLRTNFDGFASAFRSQGLAVEVGYSYKTNPLPGVLRTLHGFGAWAEVISHFELWLALALDVPPDKIVFNGPGKTQEAIELAVSRGVSIINVDNEDEIDWIARCALKHRRRQRVGVRVITSVGWSSQFGLGIAAGAAQRAFERIGAHSHLEAAGLHVHLGTGIRDITVYARAVREVLQFARVLRQALGIEIKFFDLGGGFGVPTVRPYSEWDMRLMHSGQRPTVTDVSSAASMADYARVIAALFARYAPPGEPPLVFFEPGRAITSSAQTLLVETLAIKPAAANSFNVICNGGKNIAMPLGYEYHELFAAGNPAGKGEFPYDLFGPLCHPGDVLFKGKRLPRLEPGDVIAIMDAGAYFVPNQMNFSNPRPAAVMVQGGEATLIRSRETFEDIVAHDGVVLDAAPSSLATSSKRDRQRLTG
jgi:diaminopimelate decarboxylase